jgi:hypothetical protein
MIGKLRRGVSMSLFVHKMDFWKYLPVKGIESLNAELNEHFQAVLTLPDQPGRIHPAARWEEGGDFLDAVGQQQHGAAVVAVAGVVEADADLEDALVEAADRTAFGVPFVFDLFVGFVEPAGIEELDAAEDTVRQ